MTNIPAATAARAVAGSIIRHGLTIAGTSLVAHGCVDQETVNGAVNPIAEYLVGGGIALAASGWGVLRAHAAHWRWVQAFYADPPAATPR